MKNTKKHFSFCHFEFLLSSFQSVFCKSSDTGCYGTPTLIAPRTATKSKFTLESIGIDPDFSSLAIGIVVLEHIKDEKYDDRIRVIDCHLIDKGDPNGIASPLWDI
jgi:hypothetical protein